MSQANPSLTMPSPASGKNTASATVTPVENPPLIFGQNQFGDDTAATPTHPKTQHRRHSTKRAACKRPRSRLGNKNWRKVVDHGLEIVICIGHIVGAVMLVADHLF